MFSASIVVLILAVVLGLFAQQQQTPPPFSARPCIDDPSFTLASSAFVNPCRVFSETYAEAREKFRQAATGVGAELHALQVKVPKEKSLSSEYQYTIDVAILKGKGPGLVVHTSGVHGVEGYAGSPIQIAFLESIYSKLSKENNQIPTIVLVHAVNPYGMAHYRRFNENNVDLNRNGLHPEEWKDTNTLDGTGIYEAYAKLHAWFNPEGPPTWLYALVSMWAHGGRLLLMNGFDALKSALVTGQYYENKGIFFGGQELQSSLQLLWEFFQTNPHVVIKLSTNSEEEESITSNPTGTVTWIDVHTGLGPTGVDSILFGEDITPEKHQLVHDQMERWFPGAQSPHMSESAKEANKGYDKAKGFTPAFFQRLFDADHQYLGMVQEFGTVPGILVAHALIVENRAYHYLPIEQALEWARRTTKRAFYKQTPRWRRQILERGMRLLLQAIERSSDAPSS